MPKHGSCNRCIRTGTLFDVVDEHLGIKVGLCDVCFSKWHNMLTAQEHIRRVFLTEQKYDAEPRDNSPSFLSGKRIAEQRAKIDMTLTDLAQQAGVAHSYLSMWENGKREPSDQIAIKVSKILGIDSETVLRELQRDRYERKRGKIDADYAQEL